VLTQLICGGELEFLATKKDLHVPIEARTATLDFQFVNRSNESITISRIDTACACLSTKLANDKVEYGPGEQGLLQANFSLGSLSGTLKKKVLVWTTNDPKNKPSIVLTAIVHIPELITLKPQTLHWALDEAPTPKTISITVQDGKPVHILGISSTNAHFSHSLRTIRDGFEYELTVTPADTKRTQLSVLRIRNDSSIEHRRKKTAFLVVKRSK
jgi:hypothetical protein